MSVTVTSSSPSTVYNTSSAEQTSGNLTGSSSEKYPPAHSPEKINNKIDQKVFFLNLV